MLSTLLAELLPWAIGLTAAILGLWGYGWSKKAEGRKETYIEMKARDHENADDIRNRVDGNLDQRVRELDDAGWRG